MVRSRLTPIGKLFAGLMLLFYVASVTSQSGLLLLFIGLMGGCFIVNWSFSRRNVKHLKVTPPQNICVVEGSAANQPWKIENSSAKHAEMIELHGAEGWVLRAPAVKCRDAVWLAPEAVYQRRGVYPHAQATLSSAAPFGLICSTRKLEVPGEVIVLPRIYNAESPAGVGLDMISGGRFRGSRRVNSGTHFAGVRGWQTGDSLKQVHWKTTARRGQMMVKTFEEELGGRVTVILDCAAAEGRLVDDAVRAAGSLGSAALQEGHHVEFWTAAEQHMRLAPFSDEGELLEVLARYDAASASQPLALDNFWRKSAVAIVGTAWRESWQELLAAARAQNRRTYVCLPEGVGMPEGVEAELRHFNHEAIWTVEERSVAAS